MDKELIDRVWKILPAEFKLKVKNLYQIALDATKADDPDDRKWGNYRVTLLEKLFGIHKLTSDAEGEEMLMCEKSRVQKIFAGQTEVQKSTPCGTILHHEAAAKAELLYALFGSKCLPDEEHPKQKDCDNPLADKEGCKWRNDGKCTFDSACYYEPLNPQEPKPTEPKFNYKVDDKVRVKGVNNYILCGKVGVIKKLPDEIEPFNYKIGFENDKYTYLSEEYLEPYTEPKEKSPQMKPIESKVSVYLATKEEEEEFRLLLHENGFTWNTGTSLKGCSFWVNHTEESKILYVHPDMTVTYWGNKTPDTLTFSEFKKRYFKCNDHIVQDHEMFDNIIKDGFKNHNRLHIAAMIAAGWIAHDGPKNMDPDIMAADSLTIADALIAEAEKGGDNGEV